MKKYKHILLILSILLFAGALLFEDIIEKRIRNYDAIVAQASKELSQLEKDSEKHLNDLAHKLKSVKPPQNSDFSTLGGVSEDPWFSVFIYRNDSLIWWSDNNIYPGKSEFKPGFRYFRNGWYEYLTVQADEYKVAGMLKIKNEYAFQNRFLNNSFHPCLHLPSSALIHKSQTGGHYVVKGEGKLPLFYVQFNGVDEENSRNAWIAIMYIASYLLFLLAVYFYSFQFFKSELQDRKSV